jgi:hypothetical protein
MKILVVHNFYQQPGGENVVAQQEIERLPTATRTATTRFRRAEGNFQSIR